MKAIEPEWYDESDSDICGELIRLDEMGLDWIGLDGIGLDGIGLDWIGLDLSLGFWLSGDEC